MMRHRKGPSFIQYALPVQLKEKPSPPTAPGEQAGKGKPRPVTTMVVGEESGSPPPGIVTSLALGEESG